MNFNAFLKPRKPEGVDKKSAYIVGGGLAGLAAAVFLIRDGHMKGDKIHIFEQSSTVGGSLDGKCVPKNGFVTHGTCETEDHFECLWDLFRSIPSLEIQDASVLDEFHRVNLEDPNVSNCRIIHNRGKRLESDGKFDLSPEARKEMFKLFMISEDQLFGVKIEEFFCNEFFESNFWLYWCTMLAFEKWHSVVAMRRCLQRFIHTIHEVPDLSGMKFCKYNQFESFVKPLLGFLKKKSVDIQCEMQVTDVEVEISGDAKVAKNILLKQGANNKIISLTVNDLVFVTNGSITESSTEGDHNKPPPLTHNLGGSWNLWKSLAKQSTEFGHPEVFCENLPAESWFISATITWKNLDIEPYLNSITNRKLRTGKTVTGGIITVKDSNWLLSFTIPRQPHFKEQNNQQSVGWVYALLSNKPGNHIKKPVEKCTGQEITQELLYHLGVPESDIDRISRDSAYTIPVFTPFITSYYMICKPGDRPQVIPNGSKNLAFIGNFAETKRDAVFTIEYSVRTAMEAVYQMLNVERGIPEVYASAYDMRVLARALYYLADKKKLNEMGLPIKDHQQFTAAVENFAPTYIGEILKESNLV